MQQNKRQPKRPYYMFPFALMLITWYALIEKIKKFNEKLTRVDALLTPNPEVDPDRDIFRFKWNQL